MGKTLWGAGGKGVTHSSGYLAPDASITNATGWASLESYVQFPMPVAGTFSLLGITGGGSSGAGSSASLQFRQNAANGNEFCASTTSGIGGSFQDTNHTDVVAQGDLIDVFSTGTGGGWSVTDAWGAFSATSGHVALWGTNGGSPTTWGNGQSGFLQGGGIAATNSENTVQGQITTPGTVEGMFINVATNSYSAACVFAFRKNGANGNQSISVGAGLTGIFQDTVNTDSVTTGDLVNMKMTSGGSGTLTFSATGAAISYPTPVNDFFNFGQQPTLSHGNNGQVMSMLGMDQPFTTVQEGQAQFMHGWPVYTSLLTFGVRSNSSDGSTVIALRKNGANANQSVTVGAGLTGWFTDNSDVDVFMASDLMSLGITYNGSTGSVTPHAVVLTESLNWPTAGTAAGTSTASGAGRTLGTGAGTAAATSTATGGGKSFVPRFGEADGTSSAAGTGVAIHPVAGTAAATSTASGVGVTLRRGAGTAAATSTAAGTADSTAASAGTAAATSTANGGSFAIRKGAGTASATSAAAGVGIGLHAVVGTAAATSAASGAGIAAHQVVGTANATSTAQATGASSWKAAGTAAATSSALSIAKVIHPTAGLAQGSSSAIGITNPIEAGVIVAFPPQNNVMQFQPDL